VKTQDDPVQVLLPVGEKFQTEYESIGGNEYKVYTLPEKARSAAPR